jgi:hypothetical protein
MTKPEQVWMIRAGNDNELADWPRAHVKVGGDLPTATGPVINHRATDCAR